MKATNAFVYLHKTLVIERLIASLEHKPIWLSRQRDQLSNDCEPHLRNNFDKQQVNTFDHQSTPIVKSYTSFRFVV